MTEDTFRDRVADYAELLAELGAAKLPNGAAPSPREAPVFERDGPLFWAIVLDVGQVEEDKRRALATSLGLMLVPGARADHLYPWHV